MDLPLLTVENELGADTLIDSLRTDYEIINCVITAGSVRPCFFSISR